VYATIRGVSDHLEVIQAALSTIRTTFLDLQAGSDSLSTLQDPTSALKSCEWAITELKAFADRHGGIHISTSTTPQAIPTSSKSFPGRSTLRRGWQRLGVARRANKLKDLEARLEHAKSSLQVIQANIGLALARSHKTSMQGPFWASSDERVVCEADPPCPLTFNSLPPTLHSPGLG
jgi:hypothetical protein